MTRWLTLQSKADAAAEYGDQTPAENSIMHMLGRGSDKISGKALSEAQIVAQTYTFMLAGIRNSPSAGFVLDHGVRRSVAAGRVSRLHPAIANNKSCTWLCPGPGPRPSCPKPLYAQIQQ